MDNKIHKKQSATCNCINLRRASQAITEVYDEMLSESGIKVSQYLLLNNINKLGPISVSNLALEIRLDRTTIVRNIKPLEEKGFIIDMANKGTRSRQLKLTDKGFEVLEKATPLWLAAQNFIEQYLGKEEMNTFTVLLSKIEALVP
ncbi:MarR family winged helix-turn-helix transcriptional regulator [Clostridium akagii]|uniref:MarR family winged helix-turn-helix transcriptional regulator n=1 Tax=Clostridium akagii TaxID=91623 RepID=UPI00047D8E49|nr:MarR family winged helix-turn-helix transcriptional regulator [Clostridium akagii]